MNLKKILAVGLSLSVALGVFGCNNKTDNAPKDSTTNNATTNDAKGNKYEESEYYKQYNELYSTNITPLNEYTMYGTVDSVNNNYKDKEYPGNEKYLNEVKKAYTDSKEKIQSFVDGLKNDVKTEDADLKAANDKLISEGEKLIKDIDAKIKKLDEIPKDAYDKPKDEFIKVVNDTTKLENETKNEFDKMIKDMNKMLGINPNSNPATTTPSTKTTK